MPSPTPARSRHDVHVYGLAWPVDCRKLLSACAFGLGFAACGGNDAAPTGASGSSGAPVAVAGAGSGGTNSPAGGSTSVSGSAGTDAASSGASGMSVAAGGAGGATASAAGSSGLGGAGTSSVAGSAGVSSAGAGGGGALGGGGGGGAGGGGMAGTGPVAGTTSLFDGTTLNGWLQSSKQWWTVKDGTIDGKSTTGGQLVITAADYGDFRLLVSSRMPFNAGGGHLGICFWGGRTPIGNYNKCKLYIPPGANTWDYATNGGLKNVTVANTAKPDQTQWHRTEILCRLAKGTCRVAVDGKLTLTYAEQNLASIVKGPIGLQIHAGDSEVQYKDVFVDPAPAEDKLLTVL